MNLDEAKTLLNAAARWELRDHAFGDSEFGWNDAQDYEIAGGYSGGGRCDVWINKPDGDSFGFSGKDADELKKCGTIGVIERNDETGPDQYVEGQIMPGLTKEAVWEELTQGKGMS